MNTNPKIEYTYKLVVIALLLFTVASPAVSQLQAYPQPSTHWLRLLTSNMTSVSITTLAYGDGLIYAFYQLGDENNRFHMIALYANNGSVYKSDQWTAHEYYGYNIGHVTTSAYNPYNGYLYVGTNKGLIILINSKTLKPLYAIQLFNHGNIRHMVIDYNGHINIAYKTTSAVYSIILSRYGIINIATVMFNSTDIYCTRRINPDMVLSYVLDPAGHPSLYLVNLTDSTKSVGVNLMSGGTNNDDATPAIYYDNETNTILASTITRSSGIYSTFLYNISLQGTIRAVKKISIPSTHVQLVYMNTMNTPGIQLTGTIQSPGTRKDILYMNYNMNNDQYNAWYIGGNGTEQIMTSVQTQRGEDYLFIASKTDSYGENTDYNSSFVALVSPQLVGGEQYNWNTTPAYDTPNVDVTSQTMNTTAPDTGNTGKITYENPHPYRYPRIICYNGEDISTYNAETNSDPVPIPEPIYTIVVVITTLAIYLLLKHMRKI